jgi:hypothetical protein
MMEFQKVLTLRLLTTRHKEATQENLLICGGEFFARYKLFIRVEWVIPKQFRNQTFGINNFQRITLNF